MPTLDFNSWVIAGSEAGRRKLGIAEWFAGARVGTVWCTVVVQEAVQAYAVVTALGRRADTANPSACLGRVLGVAKEAIESGHSGGVIVSGEVVNPAWNWTKGDVVFLNGTSLSTVPPAYGFVQEIGVAVGPTILVIDLGQPVLL